MCDLGARPLPRKYGHQREKTSAALVAQEFGLAYEGRSGLIALLDRLNLEYHKPKSSPHKLDEDRQQAFIEKPVRRN